MLVPVPVPVPVLSESLPLMVVSSCKPPVVGCDLELWYSVVMVTVSKNKNNRELIIFIEKAEVYSSKYSQQIS